MDLPNFCYQPWVGIDLDNDGYIKPCCKLNGKVDGWEKHNIKNVSIEEYKNSASLKKLKEDFLSGKKPAACERCWKEEDVNYPSKRKLDNATWQKEFETVDLFNPDTLLLSLPLSNICNLKCRICSPKSSSSWIKEYKDVYGDKISNNLLESTHEWKNILELCENVVEIHIHGGEPFLYDNDKHLELLSILTKSKNANKIKLHYSTNCTIFPDEKYWSLFENIGLVDIQVSIDDIGKRFEYNRKNASWSEVKQNLFKYRDIISKKPNIKLSISTTVSVFTIYYLPEFFEYIYKNNLPKPWLGRINSPAYYKCSIFPEKNKKFVVDKLLSSKNKDIRNISNWVFDNDESLLDEFFIKTKLHDSYRDERFEEIFPEISELLKR